MVEGDHPLGDVAPGAGRERVLCIGRSEGISNKAWAAIKKGLGALWEVVKHVIVLAPPVAGSTGVSGQRALDLAQQRLRQLGGVDAVAIVVRSSDCQAPIGNVWRARYKTLSTTGRSSRRS